MLHTASILLSPKAGTVLLGSVTVLSPQIQMLDVSPSAGMGYKGNHIPKDGAMFSQQPFLNARHADREFLGEDLFCAHHFDKGISLHLCQAAT